MNDDVKLINIKLPLKNIHMAIAIKQHKKLKENYENFIFKK